MRVCVRALVSACVCAGTAKVLEVVSTQASKACARAHPLGACFLATSRNLAAMRLL